MIQAQSYLVLDMYPGRVDNVYGDRHLVCTLQQENGIEENGVAAAA